MSRIPEQLDFFLSTGAVPFAPFAPWHCRVTNFCLPGGSLARSPWSVTSPARHPTLNAPSTASDSTSQGSAQRQSERWFLDEVHPHEALLTAYVRKAFPTVPDAADVVQETFLRVWKVRAAAPIRSAKAFVFQVARRIAIDVIRRRRACPEEAVCDRAASSVLDDGPSVADAVCRNEELWLLAQAIHALPARCREVMILRKIEGLSQKEIAVRLGLAEGTVQIHIGRGLRHLEKFFADRGYR